MSHSLRSAKPFDRSKVLPRLVANGLTVEERTSVLKARDLAGPSAWQPVNRHAEPVRLPFVAYIDLIFVYDDDPAMRTWVMWSDLDIWKIDVEHLMNPAVENLEDRLLDDRYTTIRKEDDHSYSVFGDMASSVVLREKRWQRLDADAKAMYIICPRRDMAFCSHTFEPDDKSWFQRAMSENWVDGELGSLNLTDEIFYRGPDTHGRWVLLPLAPSKPN